MKLKELFMINKSTLFTEIMAGITSPASIYINTTYDRIKSTDSERIKSDVMRIGKDFSKVIERENGKTKIR